MAGGRHDHGAAAVEFAVVVPVLLLLVMGTIEWGRYLYNRETVVHAAREGARAGTLLDATSTQACAAATGFLTTAGISATCGTGSGFDVTVTMNASIPDGNGGSIPGVRVRIDVAFSTVTRLPLAVPDRIAATAVMPR